MSIPEPKQSTEPSFFRYKTASAIEWLEPTVLHNRIYVPAAHQLNDPADCKPLLADVPIERLIDFYAQQWVADHPNDTAQQIEKDLLICEFNARRLGQAELMNRMVKDFHSRTGEFRVLSMSRRWNNLGLWAKYAGDHTGYCLEFANRGFFAEGREVIYYDVRPELDITADDNVSHRWLFLKSGRDWSNEEEVRVIPPLKRGGPELDFDAADLKSIILGRDIAPSDRDRVLALVARRTPPLTVQFAKWDVRRNELTLSSTP